VHVQRDLDARERSPGERLAERTFRV